MTNFCQCLSFKKIIGLGEESKKENHKIGTKNNPYPVLIYKKTRNSAITSLNRSSDEYSLYKRHQQIAWGIFEHSAKLQ